MYVCRFGLCTRLYGVWTWTTDCGPNNFMNLLLYLFHSTLLETRHSLVVFAVIFWEFLFDAEYRVRFFEEIGSIMMNFFYLYFFVSNLSNDTCSGMEYTEARKNIYTCLKHNPKYFFFKFRSWAIPFLHIIKYNCFSVLKLKYVKVKRQRPSVSCGEGYCVFVSFV